jgi:hypothetical protein
MRQHLHAEQIKVHASLTQIAKPRVEHLEPGVTWGEVELLLVPRPIRDVAVKGSKE